MNRHLRISSLLASSVVILSVLFVVLLGSKAQADTTLATESRQIPGKASSSTDPLTIDTSRSALPGVTRNAGEIIGLRFDPDPPLAGQELAILVAVRNSGSEPWDSQQLDLAVDLTNEAGETFTAYGADAALVEFVQPGQEATVSASLLLPYEQTGSFSVAATLRHQGQVVARHDSATADLTAQRTMPLVADGPESADRLLTGVSFWYPLPEDLRRAIAEGLETTALDKLPGQHYAITSDRIEGEWAMLSVAVLEGPNCGGDAFVGSGDCGAPMLAHRQDGTWQAALSGSETYAQLLAAAPQTFLDPAAKPLLDPLNQDAQALLAAQSLSVLNYKFPWPAGAWEYWNEWHQVSGGRGAMDFGIADLEPRVLAAADGAILGICRGKLSANVNIQHDDGQIYTYYHFDVNKLEAATLQGSRVQQGQVLGRLIPGSWTVAEDYNPLTKRSCGYADQSAANAHLHWEMPTTVTATVDGWSIRYPSINWQKDGQTVTPGYGSLHVIASTNEPIISNYGHAVDLVFAMDTSGSMDDEFESLCTKIDQIVAELSSRGIRLNYRILGIASVRSCATNTVTNLIPGGVSNHIEDWGPATEDLAKFYDWRPGHARLVVPMGDEGPQDGEPCNDPGADRDAVSAAIEAAQSNYVLVSPVLGTIYYQGSVECVTGLAQDLADGTSGKLFTSADSADKLATGLINIVGEAVVPDPYGEREPAELPSLEEVEANNNLFEADEDEVAQWFHEHIDDLQAFQELYHQSTNRRTRTINLPISRFYGEVNPDNNQLDNPDLIQDAQLVVCAWDIDPLEDVTIQINGQDALTLEGDPGTDREFYCRSYPLIDKLDLLRFPVSEGLSSDPIRNDALGEPVRPLAADNQFTITYSEKYKALVYSLRLIIKGVRPVVLVPGFGADANTYEWGDIKNDLIANGVSVVRPCHFQWLFEYVAFPPRWKWEVYDTGRYDGDEIEVNEYLNPRCFEAARPKPLILVELRSDIHDLGTLTRNARALRWTIDEVKTRYGVSKVNLVGHSKGGLFSRAYVDSDGGYQGDVENLISISSPQHGSFMMDIAAKDVTLPADWAETINCENSPLCNWTPEKMQEWSQKTFASMFSFKVNDTTGYEITTRGVDDRFGVDDQGNSVSPQTGVDYYAIVATAGTVSDATSLDPARNDMGQSVDYFANSLNAYDISYRLNYYQGDLDSRYQAMAGESDITIATASQQIGNLPNYGAFVDQCVVVRANHDESRRFQATANVILGILGLSEIVAPPCTVLANGDAFSVGDSLQSLSGDVSESATAQVLTYQGVVTYGQHIDTPFAVDGTHLEMTGFWQGDAGISLTLIDPDGHLIDPASALADPGMDYYQDLLPVDAAGAAGYIITDTVTGLWIARLEAPASGPAVEPMSWSLIASQQSKIELGLSTVPISTTLGMTVTVLAEPVSGTLPITNVVISGTVSGWGGITQTLAFADDGQHDDALAGDGIYGAFFYPTAPGEQWIQATTSDALPGGTPYERQADAKVMIYPDSARLTGLYNDVSIDSDGDGLFDNLDIGVEIALKKGGDFSLLGALSTQGGQLLGAVTQVVTSTVATTTWATLTFPAGLIVDAPADGPYHLSLAQIFDLESSLPADQQTAVYTTGQAYQRSHFFGLEVQVVGKPLETALDNNGNALYEQLTFDVPLLLRHPGSYTVTAWLDVTSDYGILSPPAMITSTAENALITATLRFNSAAIAIGAADGPYSVTNLLVSGPGGPAMARAFLAHTAPYSYLELEADSIMPQTIVQPLPEVISTTVIHLQWQGNDPDPSAGIAGYDVQYRVGPGGVWTDWLSGTVLTDYVFGPYLPITVTTGSSYYFRVRAEDYAGNQQPFTPDDGDVHTTVAAVDLWVNKTALGEFLQGLEGTYQIDYGNRRPMSASNVVLTDTLPSGMHYLSDNSGLPLIDSGNQIVWDISSVPGFTNKSFQITVAISPTLPGNQTVTNTLDIATASTEFRTDNNQAMAPTDIITATRDLSVDKTLYSGAPRIGEQIRYRIYYRNDGNVAADQVIITDTLPLNTTYVTHSNNYGFIPAVSGRTVCWSVNSVPSGGSGYLYVTVYIDEHAPDGTVLTNTVEISSEHQDFNDLDNSDTLLTPVIPNTRDLEVTKVKTSGTVVAGADIQYRVYFINRGNTPAANVVISDTLPPELSFISESNSYGFAASVDNGIVTWRKDVLDPNASGYLYFWSRINEDIAGDSLISNTVRVSSSDTEVEYTNNVYTYTMTTLPPTTDMYVSNTLNEGNATPGNDLTYQIYYRNYGNGPATNVFITNTLPISTTFVSASGPFLPAVIGNQLVWELGDVPGSGYSGYFDYLYFTIHLAEDAAPGTVLTSSALVTTDKAETNYANNLELDVRTVIEGFPDIQLNKYFLNSSAAQGSEINYRLNYRNNSYDAALNVIITDTLPASVTYVSSSGGPLPVLDGRDLVWHLPSVPGRYQPGYQGDIYVTLFVPTELSIGTIITNTAAINAVNDTNGSNNHRVDVRTIVGATRDLYIDKSLSSGNTRQGSELTYRVYYRNYGNAHLPDTTITDTLPLDVTFVSASGPTLPTVTDNKVVWKLGSVPGASAPGYADYLYVTVHIPEDLAAGTILGNQVQGSTSAVETGARTSIDEYRSTVQAATRDLSLYHTFYSGTPAPGQTATFRVRVYNNGNTPVSSVRLTDTLPLSTTLVTWSGDSLFTLESKTDGKLQWTAGELPGNYNSDYFYVTVRLDANATSDKELWNHVAVGTDEDEIDYENNVIAVPFRTLAIGRDLKLTKNWTGGSPLTESNLTYRLDYSNLGTLVANNVVITDTLPPSVTFSSGYASGWTQIAQGNTVTWTRASLAANSSGYINITVRVADSTSAGAMLKNVARINSTDPDPNQENNRATHSVPVAGGSRDLYLEQGLSSGVLAPGSEVVLRLYYRNYGQEAASNVIITNTLPNWLSFISASGIVTPTVQDNLIVWRLGSLPGQYNSGYNGYLYLTALISSDVLVGSRLVSKAEISTSDQETGFQSNTGNYIFTIIPATGNANLSKYLNSGVVTVGNILSYRIRVYNDGNTPIHDVVVTDTLPESLDYIANLSPYTATVSTGQISWRVGTVPRSSSAYIDFTAQVVETDPPSSEISNSAVVSSTSRESYYLDNVAADTRILIVGVPVPLAIENVDGDGEFTVSWSSVPGTVGYELQEQFDFGEWNLVHQGSDNNADRTVYMVGNWCYRVRALDYFSYGNWSNTVCTFADSVNHLIFMPAILKQ